LPSQLKHEILCKRAFLVGSSTSPDSASSPPGLLITSHITWIKPSPGLPDASVRALHRL
jgi:hypothetical protein